MYKRHFGMLIIGLAVAAVIIGVVAATVGPAGISLGDVWKVISDPAHADPIHTAILWKIRLPRVVLSFLVGAALAIAGAVMQGLIRNPMADPYIVGTSAGASFGATAAMVLNLNIQFLGISSVPLFAFIGSVCTVFLVYQLARQGAKVPVMNFLLAGMAVGFVLSALTSVITLIGIKDQNRVIYWMLGSIATGSWTEVNIIWPYLLLGLGAAIYLAKDLNLVLMGEETAHNMGVNVERMKRVVLMTAALLTAAAVSVSGVIGFVGLIIPHIVRMIVGPDHRRLIPASFIIGGVFLMLSDTVARTVAAPIEIPVGVVTALFGGPFFIYQLRTSRKN